MTGKVGEVAGSFTVSPVSCASLVTSVWISVVTVLKIL